MPICSIKLTKLIYMVPYPVLWYMHINSISAFSDPLLLFDPLIMLL